MTAVLPTTASRTPLTARPRPGRRAGLRWSWRLMRRGSWLTWLAVAGYMSVEVVVFRQAYPDAAARQKLLQLSTSAAVRMIQGVPGAVDTAGGFAVWDGGWMLMLIAGCWALLTATRLTRGEEDCGRAELVLSRPLTARQALGANLGTLGAASGGIALAAAAPLVVLGEPVPGSLLWGAGLGAFAAVSAALGALVGQLVEPRRRANATGLGLLAAAFLLRVVANSADSRAWLSALTPFGWVERLRAFSEDRWPWLLALAAAAVLLGGCAMAVRARRDTAAALLRPAERRSSRLHLLGSATGFGWRLTSGALLAWSLTLALVSFVFGLMTSALIDFIEDDETYRRMLESMGLDMAVPAAGYMSYIALFMALPFAAFLGWRVGAVRQEEAQGRLDELLVRGVVRWRWLSVTTAHAFLAGTLLVLLAGAGLWAGAQLVEAPVSAQQVAEPMAGTLPVVALFTGIAVLAFGVAPRLTVALPVTLAVLGYLLDTFGSMLDWPPSVLGLSPFHHLARLPGQPMTLTAVLVVSGIGAAAATVGVVAFSRRDLRGS